MENPITQNVFDSRDLIEYKEYLLNEILEEFNEEFNKELETEEELHSFINSLDEPNCYYLKDEVIYYNSIRDFCSELENYGDFEHGDAIIHEDYFTEYTEDLLKDCGYIPQDFPSWIELDFEATAENVKQDYIEAEFEGNNYYMRA